MKTSTNHAGPDLMQIQLAACREQGGKSQALAVLHGFCTGAARFCTGLHNLFFEWEATAAASSESRNRHTRCYPMPKGCAGISPWVSSHTRRRRKDRDSGRLLSVHEGLGRSRFACCRHTVRFFGFSFSPAHEETVSPGSLRDPRGKARTTPGPILCRSSSQLA